MSFSNWLDEQKEGSNAPNSTTLNFGGMFGGGNDESDVENNISTGGESILPLLNSNGVNIAPDLGWSNMRSSLEAQMPQKVLGMNYQQRFKVFCALLVLSSLFFFLAFTVGMTLITVRPQKFALSFTFGSLAFMGSFSILRGPWTHLSGMLTISRLPFTISYLGSMMATLYLTFNMGGPQGYVMVLAASGVQLLALLWYLIAFLPGGAQGMKYLVSTIVSMLRPIIVGCTKCFGACVVKILGRITS